MIEKSSDLKRKLQESTDDYKEEIRAALKSMTDSLGKTGINALIISGTLLTAYLLYKGLAKEAKPSKKKQLSGPQETEVREYTMMDKITDRIVEQTLLFLLAIAKEKLIEFLNETSDHNGDSETTSEEA